MANDDAPASWKKIIADLISEAMDAREEDGGDPLSFTIQVWPQSNQPAPASALSFNMALAITPSDPGEIAQIIWQKLGSGPFSLEATNSGLVYGKATLPKYVPEEKKSLIPLFVVGGLLFVGTVAVAIIETPRRYLPWNK